MMVVRVIKEMRIGRRKLEIKVLGKTLDFTDDGCEAAESLWLCTESDSLAWSVDSRTWG